jgi:hypothetical protein
VLQEVRARVRLLFTAMCGADLHACWSVVSAAYTANSARDRLLKAGCSACTISVSSLQGWC